MQKQGVERVQIIGIPLLLPADRSLGFLSLSSAIGHRAPLGVLGG
jgi:hypothetical protein